MALWRDPLDDLIADLERTLPPASTNDALDYPRQLIEMQFFLAEIMRGPRLPLAPDLPDDTSRQSASEDQQVPDLPLPSSLKPEE